MPITPDNPLPFPPWLRKTYQTTGQAPVVEALAATGVDTVCRGARCPNRAECYSRGRSAFLIMGPSCTRGCAFCAVAHDAPAVIDPTEPERIADAAARMGLTHVVVTSVTRDDLPDGGAAHFVKTVNALKQRLPDATVEILVPDFWGDPDAWDLVVDCAADVFNHNIETVPSRYDEIRPRADYDLSLALLDQAVERQPKRPVKSGLMLGLGESLDEVLDVASDLAGLGVAMITVGQYLCPDPKANLPVQRYVTPEEFASLEKTLADMGFLSVVCHPFARSSYHADAALEGLK